MSSPDATDPPGGATEIQFTSNPVQCQTSTIQWYGGLSPVRVEMYQQANDTAMWQTVNDGMFNVEYDSNSTVAHTLDWIVNVEANKNVWIVIVDHSGSFSQHKTPYRVRDGPDDSCLLSNKAKEVGANSTATVSDTNSKTMSAISAGLMGALLAALCAIGALSFWIVSLRRRLARSRQKVRHLSTDPSPTYSTAAFFSGGRPPSAAGAATAAAAAAAAYKNGQRQHSVRSTASRSSSGRSPSVDSIRSTHQLRDPFRNSAEEGPRYDDLYDEARGTTWNSGSHQNPFSDQYAALGSDTLLSHQPSFSAYSNHYDGAADNDGNTTASSSRGPRSAYAPSDEMHQMSERHSVRSEPYSIAAHSIATEATLASNSSQQSDATTLASDRMGGLGGNGGGGSTDRLGADLSRTNSGAGASTSSHDSSLAPPQIFKISINPAQFLRDTTKNRKVS